MQFRDDTGRVKIGLLQKMAGRIFFYGGGTVVLLTAQLNIDFWPIFGRHQKFGGGGG